MIAYCGLVCDRCEAFIATKKNDNALRVEVAEKWARLYGAPIKPEDINCTGCRATGVKTVYCQQLCAIRKCASGRTLSTCADCDDYPCAVLEQMFQAAPQAKVILEALRGK